MAEPARDLWHQATDGPDPLWLSSPTDRIQEAFAKFHQANPHIYDELEARCLQLQHNPRAKRIGIALLFESMRFDHLVDSIGDDYKLNNNYRALYARLLIHRQPWLASRLETRERHPGAFRRA